MKAWFEIISELLVNLAAGWFAIVFIEPQISGFTTETKFLLTQRFFLGILTLVLAKILREEGRKR